MLHHRCNVVTPPLKSVYTTAVMLLRHRRNVFTRVPRKHITEALRKIYD